MSPRSSKHNKSIKKNNDVWKQMSLWLAIGVSIITIISGFYAVKSYYIEKSKIDDNLKIVQAKETIFQMDDGYSLVAPEPTEVNLVFYGDVLCANSIIFYNSGGVPSTIIDYTATITYGPEKDTISQGTFGAFLIIGNHSNRLPKEIDSITVYILNDAPWPSHLDIQDEDMIKFPFVVELNKPIKLHLAVEVSFSADQNVTSLSPGSPELYPITPFTIRLEFHTATFKSVYSENLTCFEHVFDNATIQLLPGTPQP